MTNNTREALPDLPGIPAAIVRNDLYIMPVSNDPLVEGMNLYTAAQMREYAQAALSTAPDTERMREALGIVNRSNEVLLNRVDDVVSIAGRLALELGCLLLDTKDMAVVSKWWDSAHEALEGWQKYKAANEPDCGCGTFVDDYCDGAKEAGFKCRADAHFGTPGLLDIDKARLVLFQAIEAIKIGNKTDDKLILENLRKAGYWLCLSPSTPEQAAKSEPDAYQMAKQLAEHLHQKHHSDVVGWQACDTLKGRYFISGPQAGSESIDYCPYHAAMPEPRWLPITEEELAAGQVPDDGALIEAAEKYAEAHLASKREQPAIPAADICEEVASKSKNSLFRSAAKICAAEIKAASQEQPAPQPDAAGLPELPPMEITIDDIELTTAQARQLIAQVRAYAQQAVAQKDAEIASLKSKLTGISEHRDGLYNKANKVKQKAKEQTFPFYEEVKSLRQKNHNLRQSNQALTSKNKRLEAKLTTRSVQKLQEEVERLTKLINTPHTDDWVQAVQLEAAHQIERWGAENDAGKLPTDWVALCVYLLGKLTKAYYDNDQDKMLHHIISTSAVLLNFHRNVTGENTLMRPGIDPATRSAA